MAANRSVGRTTSSIGMMDGAFFVSRGELLTWVNNLLQVNLTKVEQCASGAIYCQIIDACHPGSVAMRKVNWMAKADHEYIPNYKVLQVAFEKNGIERHIDVDKLIRAKYQDNLEFLQFMKCYWEREGSSRRDYEPSQAREGKAVPTWAQRIGGAAGVAQEKENVIPRTAATTVKSGLAPEKRLGTVARAATSTAKLSTGPKTPRSQDGVAHAGALAPKGRDSQELAAANLEYQKKNKGLEEENDDLRSTVDGLEKERDYYFRKLRLVEMFCATRLEQSEPPLPDDLRKALEDVQGIMYSQASDDEPEAEA